MERDPEAILALMVRAPARRGGEAMGVAGVEGTAPAVGFVLAVDTSTGCQTSLGYSCASPRTCAERTSVAPGGNSIARPDANVCASLRVTTPLAASTRIPLVDPESATH